MGAFYVQLRFPTGTLTRKKSHWTGTKLSDLINKESHHTENKKCYQFLFPISSETSESRRVKPQIQFKSNVHTHLKCNKLLPHTKSYWNYFNLFQTRQTFQCRRKEFLKIAHIWTTKPKNIRFECAHCRRRSLYARIYACVCVCYITI